MGIKNAGTEAERAFRMKLGTILFLTGIFFINFTSRVVMGPMMPTVEHDLAMTHGQSGSLFLMISIGYFATMAASGFVSSRLGHRRTIILAAFTMGAVLIALSFCRSLTGIRLTLVAVGLAAGLYLPSAIASITGLISRKNWGKAMAIHEMAPNLGLIMSPLLAELFIFYWSWRGIPVVLGVVSMGAGLVFARYGHGGDSRGQAPGAQAVKSVVRQRSVWIIMALFGLAVGGSMGIYSMLPLALVAEVGLEQGTANTILAFSRVSGLFMAFAGGWASDRLGPKKAIAIILSTAGIMTILLGCVSGTWLVVMIFLQAAISAAYFPAGLSALSGIGRPEERNMVVSLAIPLGNMIGGGVIPAMIGYMGEISSFAGGMITAGLLMLVGPVLAVFLKLHRE